jgi:hypothetical protein
MTDKEIDVLLNHWAEWVARDKDSGLGFPAKTILGRLADGDITSASGFKPSAPLLNKRDYRAEAVHKSVIKLAHIDSTLSDAVTLHYCQQGSSVTKSKILGVSRRTYFTMLDRARTWLSGFLTAIAQQTINPSIQYRLDEDRGVGRPFN